MDSNNTLPQIAEGSNAVLAINENFDAASPSMIYGRDAAGCAGLVWAYIGGRWGGFLIPGDSQTIGTSTTTYMVVDKSDGEVSFSTTATNWNDSSNYARAYKIFTNASTVTSYEDFRAGASGTVSGGGGGGGGSVSSIVAGTGVAIDSSDASNPVVNVKPTCIPIACSDETTALTTGTAKVTFRMPFAFTLTQVRSSVTTAPSGAALQVDINSAGSSILSTKLTIDATEKTSTTAATPPVISDTTLDDDAEITIDVDVVGSTVAGTGLKVYLIGSPT